MKKTYIIPKIKIYQVSVCHPIVTSEEEHLGGGGNGDGITPESRPFDAFFDDSDYIPLTSLQYEYVNL